MSGLKVCRRVFGQRSILASGGGGGDVRIDRFFARFAKFNQGFVLIQVKKVDKRYFYLKGKYEKIVSLI